MGRLRQGGNGELLAGNHPSVRVEELPGQRAVEHRRYEHYYRE
ncbi:hypothetical protein [Nocardia sp. NBC_01388]